MQWRFVQPILGSGISLSWHWTKEVGTQQRVPSPALCPADDSSSPVSMLTNSVRGESSLLSTSFDGVDFQTATDLK